MFKKNYCKNTKNCIAKNVKSLNFISKITVKYSFGKPFKFWWSLKGITICKFQKISTYRHLNIKVNPGRNMDQIFQKKNY